MTKLGRVSTRTMGMPTLSFVETPDCLMPGNLYRCRPGGLRRIRCV